MGSVSLYVILLSIHLLGVFLLLFGLSILSVVLIGARRADNTERLRAAMYGGPAMGRIMPIGALLTLIGGVWLAFLKGQGYHWYSAWIVVSFVMVLIMFINGMFTIGRRMRRMGRESFVSKAGQLSPKLVAMANDPMLHYTGWSAIGVIFSFIVLMVDKPGWIGSIITVIVGILVGLGVNWLAAGPSRASREPQQAHVRKTAH